MKTKVLLVDDSNTALLMEETAFRNHAPYDVITAHDGEEGVKRAVLEKPDLILMDVVMPKMDGFEACRLIRKHESLKRVPIVMVTSRGESINVERGYQSGCNAYVNKPVSGNELLEIVRMFVRAEDQTQSSNTQ